ncbi:hypothetical protein GCM10009733_046290 [Nonomuraea maheshkhaliensis]|uniref:Transcriptional regulator n=1 Tax=Nonomuraea maheshkhaliensis TaxID=419590 RepID=A0ABN2FEZ1_9ACTN
MASAAQMGISGVSAHRHLEHLTAIGAAKVSPRYGGTGRPDRRYRRHHPS